MIYIDVAENIDDLIPEKYLNSNNFLKYLIYFFITKFNIILEKNINGKIFYILPNLDSKNINKLQKIIKVKCVTIAVLSEKLMKNNEFVNIIKSNNIKILDGKWFYKYIEEKIIDYIINMENVKPHNLEVSILINDINEINIENIKNIAKKVKVFNIVTKNEMAFKKVEKSFFDEEGIILNINNNNKKSLLKSNIIINEDFDYEELSNFELPKKACIINIQKEIKINSKYFEGINILSFDINIPKRIINTFKKAKGFKETIFYESFIYKRTSVKNIKNEIENDKIKILNLYGQNGIIRKTEFKNISNALKEKVL